MEPKEQFVQALKDSVTNTFSTILSVLPKVGEEQWHDKLFGACDTMVASVGLAGNLSGSLNFMIPKENAAKLVKKMLGSDTVSDQDVVDGIGEIINVLTGGFKMQVEREYVFQQSIPTVIQNAQGAEISSVTGADLTGVRLNCGEFEGYLLLSYSIGKNVPDEAAAPAKPKIIPQIILKDPKA